MTAREKLAMEHPQLINETFWGGCVGCPDRYGYLTRPAFCKDKLYPSEANCANCWDREIPDELTDKFNIVGNVQPIYFHRIFVIGSLSQEDEIEKTSQYYENLGYIVDHVRKQPSKAFPDLVNEAFRKIYEADQIVVVPKKDGSFGEGVTYEITFAKFVGKPITISGKEKTNEHV